MSSTTTNDYIPDDASVLSPPWTTVELAQRDVSLQIPINAVTHPAVSLTPACFGNGVYELEAAKKCISNLLAVGYRRLYVDLYWSLKSSRWSFCPVEIPSDAVGATAAPSTTITSFDSATMLDGTLTAIDLPDTATVESPFETSPPNGFDRRRAAMGSSDPSATAEASAIPMTVAPVEIPTTTSSSGETLYTLGSYACSHSLDIFTLVRILADYFDSTANTLDAHLLYLIVNLHSAARYESPDDPSRTLLSSELPSASSSLGTIFENSIGSYIYHPKQLEDERQDTDVWYDVDGDFAPVDEYFTTERNSQRHLTTDDGWPCEGYVGLTNGKRLLLGWGHIDPQMGVYDFEHDRAVIFRSGFLSSRINVSFGNGSLESGCLYDPHTKNVKEVDFSWAIAEIPNVNSTEELSTLSRQLASCGISPLVNSTLLNTTADADIKPYRNVSLSSVWSWSPGEPRNSSNINSPAIDRRHLCAVMDLSVSGQWRSTDCSDSHYAACRIGDSPFDWNVTFERVTYADAAHACPPGSKFAVPRTGLENTYLYAFLTSQPDSARNASVNTGDDHEVWIDFNSLDVATCWVDGGPKAQCPYELDYAAMERRAIIIPTVAAIVVLIITALTLFVKCNANRRNSRRRRVIEGWEYEGVPS
ncbi:hypothetical protein VTO42DRAFT_1164 [Malbranchea cinnamomea]